MKRFTDVLLALTALVIFSPVIFFAAFLIWRQDGKWPFYTPWRVGLNGQPFRLFKLRTMMVKADASKVDTTTNNDPRITPIGHKIRRYKLDELPQFGNVILGQMSLVGPRPNIDREVNLYTETEKRMLNVCPGITDISSIVFSDLGAILSNASDPNIAYNQIIRPWKSRLSLFYIDHQNMWLDLHILSATVVAILSPQRARMSMSRLLSTHGAPQELVDICSLNKSLTPKPPPGADEIVRSRNQTYIHVNSVDKKDQN